MSTAMEPGAVFPEAGGEVMPPSGPPSTDALLKLGTPQPWRSYVSAERLSDTLRFRLGCYETGERGASCSYWLTSNGLRFRVDDPVTDHASAPVIRADGRRQLCYSYGYATRLLRHVNLLTYGWTPRLNRRKRRL
jgi:hypothetical protein